MTNWQVESYLVVKSQILNLCIGALRTSLYNNAIYLMLNSVVTSLLGFAFWNIMARFFLPEQVGIGSALVAASSLVASLGNLGLGAALIRFVSVAGVNTAQLINSSFTIVGVFSIIGSLIYIAGLSYWSPALSFMGKSCSLMVIFVLSTMAIGLSGLVDQALVAGRASRYVFLKNVLISILKLPLPILIFSYLGEFGIFAATGLATVAGILLAASWFLPILYRGYRPLPTIRFDLLRPMLSYTLGNYLVALFSSVTSFVFPLMVLNLLGPKQSAYFYISWMINGVVAVIAVGTATSLFTEGSNDPRDLGRHLRRAVSITLLLLVPAVLGSIILAPWLLHFFGQDYTIHGTSLVRWLVIGNFPSTIGLFYMTVNQVHKKISLIIIQSLVSSFLTLGLGYLLMDHYSLAGIGIAYVLTQLIIALVVGLPLWRMMKIDTKITLL